MTGTTSLAPELRILLLLSRQEVDDDGVQRLKELLADREAIDWPRFLDQATRHRVAPIVSWQAERLEARLGERVLDPSVGQVLRAVALSGWRANEVLRPALLRLVAAADSAGVPVIMRKGGHLGLTVYREPSLRAMGDIDVLVPVESATALKDVLVGLGYEEGEPTKDGVRPLTRKERMFWHVYGSDLPKLSLMTGEPECPWVCIDINIDLLLPGKGYTIPVADMLDRVEVHEVQGVPLTTFSVEDTIIDLCAHLHKNSTVLRFMASGKHRRLLKFVDLAEIARTQAERLRWDLVVSRVRDYGVAPLVYFSLAHLETLFPGTVPVHVLDALGADCAEPERLLDRYGQWDLPEPAQWDVSFLERFFDPTLDRALPKTRSPV